jgi:hypothetical protein
MPCPKIQPKYNLEQSNHQALQKRMANLKDSLPSRSEDPLAQEDMPGTTTIMTSAMARLRVMGKTVAKESKKDTVVQGDMPGTTTTTTIMTNAMARPTVMEKTVTKESMKYDEWPEEDSDKEMEMEMIKLQIEMETEKVERLKRADLRRIEDDQNFLQVVTIIEKREERLSEARKKTEEARRKVREAKEEDEEWLRGVLMMEEMTPTSSPAPSPNLPAKMPIGEESCWSMEMSNVLDKRGDEMPGSREGADSMNIQEGAASSLPTPGSIKQMPPSGIARPAEEQSHCPAMVKHPAVTPSPVDMATTIKDVQELPRKKEHSLQPSQAEVNRLKLAKLRKEKRLQRMSSSRNLIQAPRDPEPSPEANPMVTKLVSKFETSPSPIKMPRPPPTSTTGCRTGPRCPISQTSIITLSPCTEPKLQTDQSAGD